MSDAFPTPPWPDPQDPMFRAMIERGLKVLEESGLVFAVVASVGHGWREGHVLAEQSRDPVPEPLFTASDEHPTPPFPASESDEFAELVAAELKRAEHGELTDTEIIISAVARGWSRGYAEGLSCIGCNPPGGERTLALRSLLRKGLIPIRPERSSGEEALMDAVIATYKEQLVALSGK